MSQSVEYDEDALRTGAEAVRVYRDVLVAKLGARADELEAILWTDTAAGLREAIDIIREYDW